MQLTMLTCIVNPSHSLSDRHMTVMGLEDTFGYLNEYSFIM